jgi:hypothetical protein
MSVHCEQSSKPLVLINVEEVSSASEQLARQ